MSKLRSRRFRALIGALAVLGAVLNAWVLVIHMTSVALGNLRADDGAFIICHQGAPTSFADLGLKSPKPASKKQCPICSGLAALHFGVVTEPNLHMAPFAARATAVSVTMDALIDDHRLHQILNRGPPISV